MKQFRSILLISFLIISLCASAKRNSVVLSGTVYEKINNTCIPISWANIHCKGTVEGVISSELGDFQLDLSEGRYMVIFSYAGYENVTREIVVKRKNKKRRMYVEVVLEKNSLNQLANK